MQYILNQAKEILIDEQVERCRNGDRQACFEIYRKYAKPMLNSSMRIVNNLADAEDMVQEAFADAFNNINTFTYKSSFEAWLRRIVINKSISLIRKRRIKWIDFETATCIKPDEEPPNDELMNYNVQCIKSAIDRLPYPQKIVFNMFAIDELPQEEIAKLLGLSHGNVRIIYHRARKKIIETLNSKI